MSRNETATQFDVFLSHNSKDKPAVRRLKKALVKRGLTPWLDEDELVPGRPWQEALEDIIETTASAAVLVGKDGMGPWQNQETRAALSEFVGRGLPVIPVLLPGATKKPKFPLFLRAFMWVDLRDGLKKEGLGRLESGIRGKSPGGGNTSQDEEPAPSELGQYVLVLSATISDVDRGRAEAIVAHLRELSHDARLTLRRVEPGSVRLVLNGSRAGFEKLENLLASGKLQERLELEVIDLKWLHTHRSVHGRLAINLLPSTGLINQRVVPGSERPVSVFISHAADDRAAYSSLCAALDGADINRWDPDQMVAGAALTDDLREAINACDACVFIATRKSVESQWCMAELGAFWGANKPVVIFVAEPMGELLLPPQFRHVLRTDDATKVIVAARDVATKKALTGTIFGRRLFQYEGYYPVDLAPETNSPSLSQDIFVKALAFLNDEVDDRMAAMDLVYLREDNKHHSRDVLPKQSENDYSRLIEKYDLARFRRDYSRETERLFRNTIRIVNDLGDTLRGVFFEALLHDVRNPLRSIIAAKNTEGISGRRLYDPSTRFVVQYVRDQGRQLFDAMQSGSKVSYPKQFLKTKKVKATTTPLFDDEYGLIGILCFNIDIDQVTAMDMHETQDFLTRYTQTFGETPEFEKDSAPSRPH